MSPILYLSLAIILGACWGIVHYLGLPWLLAGIALWVTWLVWVKGGKPKDKDDQP